MIIIIIIVVVVFRHDRIECCCRGHMCEYSVVDVVVGDIVIIVG